MNKITKLMIVVFLIILMATSVIAWSLGVLFKNSSFTNKIRGDDLSITPIYKIQENKPVAPSIRLNFSDIKVYKDRVVFYINNPELINIIGNHSMVPVVDTGHKSVGIIPKDVNDIKLGDIVVFNIKNGKGYMGHRIIKTGYDEKGIYYLTKGDNKKKIDTGKLRFNDIVYVLIMVIY